MQKPPNVDPGHGYIYVHYRHDNMTCYVGQTVTKRRPNQHLWASTGGYVYEALDPKNNEIITEFPIQNVLWGPELDAAEIKQMLIEQGKGFTLINKNGPNDTTPFAYHNRDMALRRVEDPEYDKEKYEELRSYSLLGQEAIKKLIDENEEYAAEHQKRIEAWCRSGIEAQNKLRVSSPEWSELEKERCRIANQIYREMRASDPVYDQEQKELKAEVMRQSNEKVKIRREEDPEWAAELDRKNSENKTGKPSYLSKTKFKCGGCTMETSISALTGHQKVSLHTGIIDITDQFNGDIPLKKDEPHVRKRIYTTKDVKCNGPGCTKECAPGPMKRHQDASGHIGWSKIDEEKD